MSGDRRLAISSLLNDDDAQQPYSPLEALVHAATEERRRLSDDVTHRPRHPAFVEDKFSHRPPDVDDRWHPHQILHDQHRTVMPPQQRLQDPVRTAPPPQERRRFDPIDRQRQEDHVRDLDRQRQLQAELDRQQVEAAQQRAHQERLMEEQRVREERQRQQREYDRQQQHQHLEFERQQRRFSDPYRNPSTSHPASISHLISHSPQLPASPIAADPPPSFPPADDSRPTKKPRVSHSPAHSDDRDRISRDRDRMFVGELGYGRVESPPSQPNPPRRPGSGQGVARKPALADLLVDKDHYPEPVRVVSPLGQRSPPGSQIGRAKAARKSDEQSLPPPPVPRPKDDLRRTSAPEEPRELKKESMARIVSPPQPPPPHRPHDDAHDWFLQQVAKPVARPAHTPVAPPNPIRKSPPVIADTIDAELEELVSRPVKKQEEEESTPQGMDLDVDKVVADLVAETLDDKTSVKREPASMEVDVEDELLSLVDDRPLPSSARKVQRPISPRPPLPARTSIPPTAAPPILPPTPQTKSGSERGSMPPPASTSTASASTKKSSSSTPVIPDAPPSKKTKTTAKDSKETAPKPKVSKEKTSVTTSATTSSATSVLPAKAKPKATTKGKKAVSDRATPVPQAAPAKGKSGKKTPGSTSRSRSTSLMPPNPDPDTSVQPDKQEEEEEEPNEDDKLYCICKTKYDEDRAMIACDKCDEWYHTQCVDMPEAEVDLVDQFFCPPCIQKHPKLNLQTTYKTRCLYGLRHPDPSSSKACHKAARGAFSKYCSEECGVKYMQSRIDNWAKKGGKPDKLWDSVKHAEKREAVVVIVEQEVKTNGACSKMDVDESSPGPCANEETKTAIKQHPLAPSKTRVEKETDRLNGLLDGVNKLREEVKKGLEIVVLRKQVLEHAAERAEEVGQCGWDQRLTLDDEEWAEIGESVLESYGAKEEEQDEPMDLDQQWWCDAAGKCERHGDWQVLRSKELKKEEELKDDALAKLNTREQEIRKRIEDLLDPHNNHDDDDTNINPPNPPSDTPSVPLKSSNTKLANGHSKASKSSSAGDAQKKGKKRKAPVSS